MWWINCQIPVFGVSKCYIRGVYPFKRGTVYPSSLDEKQSRHRLLYDVTRTSEYWKDDEFPSKFVIHRQTLKENNVWPVQEYDNQYDNSIRINVVTSADWLLIIKKISFKGQEKKIDLTVFFCHFDLVSSLIQMFSLIHYHQYRNQTHLNCQSPRNENRQQIIETTIVLIKERMSII